MAEVIAGFFCLLLGVYQLYATYKMFFQLKKHGNKNTSPFILGSFWSSAVFGAILFGIGISLVFQLI